jgi:hypothetical protein
MAKAVSLVIRTKGSGALKIVISTYADDVVETAVDVTTVLEMIVAMDNYDLN